MTTTLYIIIGVTVVALIVLLVVFFIQKRKAKRAAALEDGSQAPGGDDISVLIHEAEAKMAAAKIGRSKVGTVPVYVIAGEPGTTKTSVMLHCGLEPELISGQVYQAGNVTPTRTANFWFSRNSLFVEAGGPLTGDANKWRAAVKKLAPKASVSKGEQAGRAAIVCFDCENFTKPGALDLVAASSRNLRARLGEISQAMGINLPVYVLFTKTDRLPFFTDFVRNLTNDEATQVVGVTLPMTGQRSDGVYAEQETARLTFSFERLFHSVADARPEFLARESDPSKLPPSYEFPREFRKIRPAVVQFLVDLCRPSQLTVGPFLRGFYFTGVRPVIINEAAPVASVAQQQAFAAPSGATGIFSAKMLQQQAAAPMQAPAQPAAGGKKVPQWLFLSHLFNDVLLADKVALGASGASIKTSSTRRMLLIAAASLCFLLTVFWTISFFRNHSIEGQVADAAHGISSSESAGGSLASLESLQKLDRLRQALETLVKYRHEGRPFLMGGGLYIGDDLYQRARPIYCDRFRKLLLTQTQRNILSDMKSLPPRPDPASHDYQPTYEELKAYLITTSFPDKSTPAFLTPVLMRWWSKGHDVDTDRTLLAQKQFDFYAAELREPNPCAAEGDRDGVTWARNYLKQFGAFEKVYGYMLGEADKAGKSVNFNRDFPGSAAYVIDGYEVRGAFTKAGWNFMKNNFGRADQFFGGEQWVLGESGVGNLDKAALVRDLQQRYYSDFIEAWKNYLNKAAVVRYGSLRDAANKLKSHSSNVAPLLELSSVASQNTAVDEPSVASVFQPVQSVTPPTNPNYVAASNQGYINALAQLQASIDLVADKPPDDAAAGATLQLAKTAETSVSAMAQPFDIRSPIQGTVTRLLTDPITYAEALLKGVGAAELNAGGAGVCKVVDPILLKYPFNPSNKSEATIQDLVTVFKPKEGVIWNFVDSKLVPKYLTKQGTDYVPASSGGTVTILQPFIDWVNRASRFASAAFKDGSTEPRFTYTVKPQFSGDLTGVKLSLDAQSNAFSTSDAAKPFTWPGSGAHKPELELTFGGQTFSSSQTEGLWATFHFFDSCERAGNVFTKRYVEQGGNQVYYGASHLPVLVRLEVNANPPVFDKGFFTLRCVPNVAR